MSWDLDIWTPNRATLLNHLTDLDPGGLDGGFTWQRQGNGDCIQLKLAGRNDLLGMGPRAVVRLAVDGKRVFYGVVPDPPSATSPDAEEAQVLGGREALRLTLLDGTVYREQGVYAIVRDILTRRCPPALTYLPTLIGDGSGTDAGPTLSTYYAPTADLVTVLDALAKSAGTSWGVDAEGQVFFGRPAAPTLTVAYAGQGWRRLRVQGREAVTRAVLRVVSAPTEGVTGTTVLADGRLYSYVPATLTQIAESPAHPLYQAEAAFSVPEGVSVSREHRTGTVRSYGIASSELAFDADPATAATSTVTLPSLDLESTERVIGVRVRYRLSGGELISGRVTVFHDSTANGSGSYDELRMDLPPSDGARDLIVLAPPSAALASIGVQRSWARVEVWRAPHDATDVLSVHDLALIVVDEAAAQRTADALLQLPFASPAEITLDHLAEPAETAAVTGSPDGDVSGPTGLFEYEHSPDDVRSTKVRLGATGSSDAVRALRWAVRT